MIDTPVLAEVREQPIAVLRPVVPRAEIQQVMGPGLQELRAAVAAQGIAVTGPWFTHHLGMDPDMGQAWGELMTWMEANGHAPADDLWERYVAGPESGADPAGWRTELNRPVSGAGPASGATGG